MDDTGDMSKRSYAQRDAQLKATEAARGAAARRADEARRRAEAEADRLRAEAEHEHRYGNWFYVLDWTHEVRECGCGYAQMRPVRL
jgi:hypothetical protein